MLSLSSYAFQDNFGHRFGRRIPLGIIEPFSAVERDHLMLKIGVVLGGGPDHVEQVAGVYGVNLAFGNPAVDDLDAAVCPRAEGGLQIVLDDRRALDDLVGPDLGAAGVGAADFHFFANIAAEGFAGAGGGVKALCRFQPDGENALDHLTVERQFGGEIVVQVGFGQAGGIGDA